MKPWLRCGRRSADYKHRTLHAGLVGVFSFSLCVYVGPSLWRRTAWRCYFDRWYKGGEVWLGPCRVFWAYGEAAWDPEQEEAEERSEGTRADDKGVRE